MPQIQGNNVISGVEPRSIKRDVIITTAEVLALFATPIEIVPAPAAGFFNEFISMTVHKPAGVAYAGIASGEDLSVKYTNAAGLQVAIIETTGFLDSTAALTRQARLTNITAIVPTLAASLVFHLLIAEIITGDSDLNLSIEYKVRKADTQA